MFFFSEDLVHEIVVTNQLINHHSFSLCLLGSFCTPFGLFFPFMAIGTRNYIGVVSLGVMALAS